MSSTTLPCEYELLEDLQCLLLNLSDQGSFGWSIYTKARMKKNCFVFSIIRAMLASLVKDFRMLTTKKGKRLVPHSFAELRMVAVYSNSGWCFACSLKPPRSVQRLYLPTAVVLFLRHEHLVECAEYQGVISHLLNYLRIICPVLQKKSGHSCSQVRKLNCLAVWLLSLIISRYRSPIPMEV